MEGSKIFTVMVVGDDHEKMMAEYDANKKCEPRVKYKFKDRAKLHRNAITILDTLLSSPTGYNLTDVAREALEESLEKTRNMSDFEYYRHLVNGLEINDSGDAVTTDNENGMWTTARKAHNIGMMLYLKDGTETNQAKMSEIDWERTHRYNIGLYLRAWELCVDGAEPKDENDSKMLNNMSDNLDYFDNFSDKEEYANYITSFFENVCLNKDGWHDIDDCNDSKDWAINFYDRFVKGVGDDELITLYECSLAQQ